MYYHVHIFNIMEFKNIRSVCNGRWNGNGIAILQWPTYGSSRLLQICLHFFVNNKYCVSKYGTMYYHGHIFNIMEIKNIRSLWNGRSNGNGRPILHWPTNGSSRLLQICHHFLLHNKYCALKYGTMCYHVHKFNIMEFKISGQYGMSGQMGMEDPFYNDQPMVLHDYYKYAIISLYTTSIVY